MDRSSECRAERVACELLEIRGWSTARPPKGNVLWKNEYHDYPELADAFAGASKTGDGRGYPEFVVVSHDGMRPLLVGETKADAKDIDKAVGEACHYADALAEHGLDVLAVGVAGDERSKVQAVVQKRLARKWKPIKYRDNPIQWLPTPDETSHLLANPNLFELAPRVPSVEVLAQRGDEINRILRECSITDAMRPAVVGAFMLGIWKSKGKLPDDPEYILLAINKACQKAFEDAGKLSIATSISLPEANEKLAQRAHKICHILWLLNVPSLTSEHDYLGQLYEMFFRLIGPNTIGQFFTPRHVTRFMADIMEVGPEDFVVDPTCGTGGFLVASLNRMTGNRHYTQAQIRQLVAKHLRGFESEPITAALCVANMILRGDGTTGIVTGDCFTDPSFPEGECTIALGNPPFPHAKTDTPSERFVDRALESLRARGNVAMIVPMSILHKSGHRRWRTDVLKSHTLRAVIELPGELFEPYASSTTAIIVLEKGVKHNWQRHTFFCRIANDGYRLKKSVRIEQPGEQLSTALAAFEGKQSFPGFCVWTPLVGDDWGPGGFIESAAYGEDEVREKVEGLFRSETAFHSLYAHNLVQFRESLEAGTLKSQRYAQMAGKKPRDTDDRPGRLGHYFNIYYGQRQLHNKERLISGESLIISSSGTDNGCYGFFAFEDLIRPPFVTVPGTGSIGEAYVQTWPCGVTDHCLLLVPREGTADELLWIAAAVIRLEQWRFNYGRGITADRIASFVIPEENKGLRQWLRKRRAEVNRLNEEILESYGAKKGAARFKELAEQWRREVRQNGSVRHMAMHTAYQSIIGMGKPAIPLILGELAKETDHWFWALHAITGENPVPEEDQGNLQAMARSWIAWGKRQGYR